MLRNEYNSKFKQWKRIVSRDEIWNKIAETSFDSIHSTLRTLLTQQSTHVSATGFKNFHLCTHLTQLSPLNPFTFTSALLTYGPSRKGAHNNCYKTKLTEWLSKQGVKVTDTLKKTDVLQAVRGIIERNFVHVLSCES
jgi:hypothetical protein